MCGKNNVSIQTDNSFNIHVLNTKLAEKKQHVKELKRQAAKFRGLHMDDFDNETENSINDEDDADDMWNDIN